MTGYTFVLRLNLWVSQAQTPVLLCNLHRTFPRCHISGQWAGKGPAVHMRRSDLVCAAEVTGLQDPGLHVSLTFNS